MSMNSAMLDSAFAAFGEPASYTPAGGGAVSIRLIPSQEDEIVSIGQSRIKSDKALFEVRVSQLAAPAAGDQLVFGGTTYKVKSFRYPDPDRLIWMLECYAA